jgi:hypothetical protein
MGVFGWMFDKYLPVGVECAFLGQPRKVGLLTNFDINQEGKVALDVRYVGLEKNEMTGYWFDVNDFSPALDSIDIRSYGGILVCWKNLQGESNFMPPELQRKNSEILNLKHLLDIYKKNNLNLLSLIEGNKIDEAKKRETLEYAKQLKAMREVVADKEVMNVKRDQGNIAGSLFTR